MNLVVVITGILHDFKIGNKILSVTCDNASNNDRMVIEMSKRLTKFLAVNCTQCFTHIFNLVAKSLLKQFDAKINRMNQLNDEDEHLFALAGNIEDEECTVAQQNNPDNGEPNNEDDEEGWVDELQALSQRHEKI